MVRPDAGVKDIEDLKGKTLLTTANAGVNTFFPLVLKNAGLAEDDVKLTNVPDGALVSSYLQRRRRRGRHARRARRQAGRDQGEWRRQQPVAFPYSDYGVNQVGYCIVTNKETVKNNPDLVKRFMAATVKAYKETEKNPDAAVAAMADIVGGTMAEDAGKAQAREVLDVTLGILYSAGNKDKRSASTCRRTGMTMLALMKKYNDLKTDQPATAFYTNDFVPQ